MHMLFIFGPPASGKLTIGKQVAKRMGFALFHNHLIVDALLAVFPFGTPEFIRLRDAFWTETIHTAARAGRSLVFTFCPEPTVDPRFPERMEELVQAEGGTLSFIRLDVSTEEQERRLVAPSRTGGKLRDVNLLRSVRSAFAESMAAMPTATLSIDTNLTAASAAADRIVQLLRQ